MTKSSVINYYKTHSNLSTRKKFGLTYKELTAICNEANFKKSPEQIKETYKKTKEEKYGSLEKAYKEMYKHKEETILKTYGSYDLYYEIRCNNSRKTNNKRLGVDYPMQNTEIVNKSNKTKRRKNKSYENDL